jgi:hypothetical protein
MGTYSMSISQDGKYIHIRVFGEKTRELAKTIAVEASRVGKELDVHRVLLDFTEPSNSESVFKIYELAYSDMSQEEVDKKVVLACLVNPGDHSYDFAETMFRNAGFNFQLFDDLNEAIGFLQGS